MKGKGSKGARTRGTPRSPPLAKGDAASDAASTSGSNAIRTADASAAPRRVWKKKISQKSGRAFYVNVVTKAKQWSSPGDGLIIISSTAPKAKKKKTTTAKSSSAGATSIVRAGSFREAQHAAELGELRTAHAEKHVALAEERAAHAATAAKLVELEAQRTAAVEQEAHHAAELSELRAAHTAHLEALAPEQAATVAKHAAALEEHVQTAERAEAASAEQAAKHDAALSIWQATLKEQVQTAKHVAAQEQQASAEQEARHAAQLRELSAAHATELEAHAAQIVALAAAHHDTAAENTAILDEANRKLRAEVKIAHSQSAAMTNVMMAKHVAEMSELRAAHKQEVASAVAAMEVAREELTRAAIAAAAAKHAAETAHARELEEAATKRPMQAVAKDAKKMSAMLHVVAENERLRANFETLRAQTRVAAAAAINAAEAHHRAKVKTLLAEHGDALEVAHSGASAKAEVGMKLLQNIFGATVPRKMSTATKTATDDAGVAPLSVPMTIPRAPTNRRDPWAAKPQQLDLPPRNEVVAPSQSAVVQWKSTLYMQNLGDVIAALFPGDERVVRRERWIKEFGVIMGPRVSEADHAWFFDAVLRAADGKKCELLASKGKASIEVTTSALSTFCMADRDDVCDEVFRAYDTDENGTLGTEEVAHYLHSVIALTLRFRDMNTPIDRKKAAHLARTLAASMFSTLDATNSGGIDRTEFKLWIDQIAPPKPVEAGDAEAVEEGGSARTIEPEATSTQADIAALERALLHVDLLEVEASLFPAGDTTRCVTHLEFCDKMVALIGSDAAVLRKPLSFFFGAMSGTSESGSVGVAVITAALATKCIEIHSDVTDAVFRVFDADGNGTLSRDEIQSFLVVVMQMTIRLKQCETQFSEQDAATAASFASAVTMDMFETMDTNGDENVDKTEFTAWLKLRMPRTPVASDANSSEAAGDTPFSKPVRVHWRRHTYAEVLASVNFGLLVGDAAIDTAIDTDGGALKRAPAVRPAPPPGRRRSFNVASVYIPTEVDEEATADPRAQVSSGGGGGVQWTRHAYAEALAVVGLGLIVGESSGSTDAESEAAVAATSCTVTDSSFATPPATSTKGAMTTLRQELSALDLLLVEDKLFPDGARCVEQELFCSALAAMLGEKSAVSPATLAFLFRAIAVLGGNSSVDLTSTRVTGWLEKKASHGAWQPRFCCLRGRVLHYAAKKAKNGETQMWDSKIEMTGERVRIEQLNINRSAVLRIASTGRTTHLRAYNAAPGVSICEWFEACTEAYEARVEDVSTIDVEVATASLATLCSSSTSHVGDSVYRVFDVDGNGSLSEAELSRFLIIVIELSFRLRDCSVSYDAAHTATASRLADAVVEDMFAKIDLDGSGSIDRIEFETWLLSVVSPPPLEVVSEKEDSAHEAASEIDDENVKPVLHKHTPKPPHRRAASPDKYTPEPPHAPLPPHVMSNAANARAVLDVAAHHSNGAPALVEAELARSVNETAAVQAMLDAAGEELAHERQSCAPAVAVHEVELARISRTAEERASDVTLEMQQLEARATSFEAERTDSQSEFLSVQAMLAHGHQQLEQRAASDAAATLEREELTQTLEVELTDNQSELATVPAMLHTAGENSKLERQRVASDAAAASLEREEIMQRATTLEVELTDSQSELATVQAMLHAAGENSKLECQRVASDAAAAALELDAVLQNKLLAVVRATLGERQQLELDFAERDARREREWLRFKAESSSTLAVAQTALAEARAKVEETQPVAREDNGIAGFFDDDEVDSDIEERARSIVAVRVACADRAGVEQRNWAGIYTSLKRRGAKVNNALLYACTTDESKLMWRAMSGAWYIGKAMDAGTSIGVIRCTSLDSLAPIDLTWEYQDASGAWCQTLRTPLTVVEMEVDTEVEAREEQRRRGGVATQRGVRNGQMLHSFVTESKVSFRPRAGRRGSLRSPRVK